MIEKGKPFVIFDLKGDPDVYEVCGVATDGVVELMKQDSEYDDLIYQCIAEIHKLLHDKQNKALMHLSSVERISNGLDA